MDHANLLETLENVIPEDMLLRIAPAVSPSASPAADSLTSLRESAAARFQNENVSGSDDEKPEPLAQSPSIDSTRSPPGEQFSSDTQRTSLRPGSAAPSTSSSSNSLHARRKRQSMFSSSSAQSPHLQPPAARRFSMPQSSASVTLQSFALADGSQGNSPLSVTVSPVAQRHEPPLSSASRAAGERDLTPPSRAPVRSSFSSTSDQQSAAAIVETNAHRVRFEEKQKVEVLDGSNKSPSGSGPKIHSWNTASDSRMATASNMVHATAPRSVNGSRRKSTL